MKAVDLGEIALLHAKAYQSAAERMRDRDPNAGQRFIDQSTPMYAAWRAQSEALWALHFGYIKISEDYLAEAQRAIDEEKGYNRDGLDASPGYGENGAPG